MPINVPAMTLAMGQAGIEPWKRLYGCGEGGGGEDVNDGRIDTFLASLLVCAVQTLVLIVA